MDVPVQYPSSIERRRQILLLQFYILEFPHKLKHFADMNFEHKSDVELKLLKDEFDFIIGAKSNVKVAQGTFGQAVSLFENLCVNYTPLNVKGLSAVIDDKDLQDDVKHLALKYMTIMKTEPEHRIAYKMLTCMLLLHQTNSASIRANSMNIDASKIAELNKKYSDL